MVAKKKVPKKAVLHERLKKQKKLLIILGVILVISVLGYYTLGLQVKFILEEEMDLDLVPAEASFTVPYTESAQVNFTLRVDRPNVCSFTCDHEFVDLSTGETLDKKTTRSQTVSSAYELTVDTKGEGQHLYSYNVVCHNLKSSFCSTNEKNYFKSSLISVNYELPAEEQQAKQTSQQLLEDFLSEVASLEVELDYLAEYEEQYALNDTAADLRQELQQTARPPEQLWNDQDFLLLESSFTQYQSELENLNSTIRARVAEAEQTAAAIREATQFLHNQSNETRLEAALPLLNGTNFDTDNYIMQLNATLQSNASYPQLLKSVADLRVLHAALTDELAREQALQQTQLAALFEQQNKYYEDVDLNRTLLNTSLSCDVLFEEQEFLQARNLSQARAAYNASEAYFENLSTAFFAGDDLSNETLNGTPVTSLPLANLLTLPLPELATCTPANITLAPYVQPSFTNISRDSPSAVMLDQHEPLCCYGGDCQACCTAETCQETYPVIFVHGHALSESNTPEESHSAFGVIQRMLEDEEGYIDAGQLGADSAFTIPAGDWGRVNAPIAIRISYYLITYVDLGQYQVRSQKTDKIENYATRLKDLVETIKYRTGKDKVDIVAHSMGGLVTREYIALFGEESVNKLVLVGTPNRGVEGRVERLCSLTGASRECEDMASDSIFLKRLNTPQNAFQEIDGYTIRAVGCDMDGEDGDGIVLARSVPLNYTTNLEIEGECTDSLDSNLHTRMLNPNEYPETYELIRAILVS